MNVETHNCLTTCSYLGCRRLVHDIKEVHMRSRMMKLGATIGALASLAVGGSAIATAAQKSGAAVPPPVTAIAPAAADTSSAIDGDNVQQGDQSTPDAAGAAEAPDSAATESASESSAASDGPGGHADAAGTVDNQQQGEN
jgi:hypothetical protein